jgi:hypothetical protein
MRRPNSSNLSIFLSVVRFEPLHLKNIRFSLRNHTIDISPAAEADWRNSDYAIYQDLL